MNADVRTVFGRHAGVLRDRRSSLRALGVAALGAMAVPPLAASAKPSPGKRAKKQCQRRCQEQAVACTDHVAIICRKSQPCIDSLTPCCASLGTCDAATFFACTRQSSPGNQQP